MKIGKSLFLSVSLVFQECFFLDKSYLSKLKYVQVLSYEADEKNLSLAS